MHMRRSRVLEKMRAGQIATCVKLNIDHPRNVALAAMSGVDCVWIDLEHVPSGIGVVEPAVLAAKAHDCDVLTRVARGSYNDYVKPLEADSAGIMVPHLMSLAEAERVQYYTKFHPIGRRPIDGGNADGAFCLIEPAEYIREANRERFVAVQIEDPEPLKELDAICSLPGIDMIFFGPADFSQGAGIPFDWAHPLMKETCRQIAATARRHGKFAGTVGGPDNFAELAALGYTFINLGADVVALAEYYRGLAAGCANRPIAAL